MAQGVSSHLNRSSSGYERSGPQCQSFVPVGPWKSQLSGHCEMAGQVVLFRDSPPKKKEDSITVLVCRNVPEAVLTCRSSGCSSTVAYFRWILILLGHAISCSLYISVSRLIALRSWRLCHPRSLIISVKLDFYDNRFSHSVQFCIELFSSVATSPFSLGFHTELQ